MTKRVIHDRNVVMAFRMQRQLRRGDAFVALGALHLYGEQGRARAAGGGRLPRDEGLLSRGRPHLRARQQHAALLDAGLPVSAVISNRADAEGLALARRARHRHARRRASRATRRAKPSTPRSPREIDRFAPRLVALAGFMRILTPGFVARYRERLLNIHPSLLPAFPGLDTHERALAAGVKVHGCTVHFVTAELDHGPIVVQAAVPVRADDDAASLAARVLQQEHVVYPRAVRWFLDGRLALGDGVVHVKGNDAQLVLAARLASRCPRPRRRRAPLPARVEIEYELKRNGSTMAEVVERLEHANGSYQLTETLEGQGHLRAARQGEAHQRGHARRRRACGRSEYVDERSGRDTQRVSFDWKANTITRRYKGDDAHRAGAAGHAGPAFVPVRAHLRLAQRRSRSASTSPTAAACRATRTSPPAASG